MTSRRDRELKAAHDAQRKARPKIGDARAVLAKIRQQPDPEPLPPRDTVSSAGTVPRRHPLPAHRDTVSLGETVPACDTVPAVAGYLKVPNTILDSVAALLPPHEFVVYLRLVRLSRGYNRETCTVGYARLAASCRMGKTKTVEAIKRLEHLGFVEVVAGANTTERAPVYRVRVPGETVPPADTVSRHSTVPQGEPMKGISKEDHESGPLETLRQVARSYRHQNPSATNEQVRARLLAFCHREGWPADEATLAAAAG